MKQRLQLVFEFQDDPAEANYSYECRIVNQHFKGAKVVAREMTEEEKAEAEAKNKKVPDAKKGAKKDEEPSAEELQKWEEEKKEREEANAKARAEWDALDDNTKFFRTCEDPFKEASIRFLTDGTVEDAPDPSVQEVELENAALRAFESSVCD